jgi:hypothetical protein
MQPTMPTGFNYVPDYYVIGQECYFEGSSPVNPETWPLFKRLQERHDRLQLLLRQPMAFSIELINKTFSPVKNMATGMIIRDAIFQFHSFIKNLNDDHLSLRYDDNYRSFIIGYDHLYNKECGN